MAAPRDAVLEKVVQWVRYAEEDLRLSEHAMSMSESCPYRLVAYHAQQCAEKYLKAYLILRGIDFPYTHNISTLLELCEPHASWPDSLRDAERLTAYAITTRYPGVEYEVTEKDARQAMTIAKDVRTRVRPDLVNGGVDL